MEKKIYIGGLPWELDRIGLLNYFKAILEGHDIAGSYELPFIASPLLNPNATVRVVDVFVALDRQTNKSRGFGFITLDLISEDPEGMFVNIVEMLNGQMLIGIRGPRELIVKEADPRNDEGPRNGAAPVAEEGNEATEPAAEGGVNIDW